MQVTMVTKYFSKTTLCSAVGTPTSLLHGEKSKVFSINYQKNNKACVVLIFFFLLYSCVDPSHVRKIFCGRPVKFTQGSA